MEKKSINNKKKKKKKKKNRQPACVFSMNQSLAQAIHREGKGRIPVSAACFNYSIAEV